MEESVDPTIVNDVLLINVYDYPANIVLPPAARHAVNTAKLAWGRVWTVVGVGAPHGQPDKVRLILREPRWMPVSDGTELSTVIFWHAGPNIRKDYQGNDIKAKAAIAAGDEGTMGKHAPWFKWIDTSQCDLVNAVDQLVEKVNENVEDYSCLAAEVFQLRDRVQKLGMQIEQILRGQKGEGEQE